MAISSNKFVKVTSNILVTQSMSRDYSGLVISNGTAKIGTLGAKYDAGDTVAVNYTTLGDLFESTTDEYKWAVNYFRYLSPSGTMASQLKFRKRLSTASESATASVPSGQTGVTGASVEADDFGAKVGNENGDYVFTASVSGSTTTWSMGGSVVTLSDYGVSVTGTAVNGNTLTVKYRKATTAESALDAFKNAVAGTENFGCVTFLSGKSGGTSSLTDLKEVAEYIIDYLNNTYRMVVDYSLDSSATNYYGTLVPESSGTYGGLYGYKGVTLCNDCSFLTMARLAATDYTGTNTTSCDMFKSIDGVSATVKSDAVYETLVARRLNFIGLVKEHGNQWSWYMRGFNMDGTDTACYDNEMWFKSEIILNLLDLEDSLEKIPANDQGLSLVSVSLQSVINQALKNGTILPNKPLSTEKELEVRQWLGGSSELMEQLSTTGWVLLLSLAVEGEEYKIKYKIAYLKGDSVRFIEGAHTVA